MAPAEQAVLKHCGRTKLVVAGDVNVGDLDGLRSLFGLSIERLPTDRIDVSAPDLLAVLVLANERDPPSTQVRLIQLIDRNVFEYGVFLIVAAFDGALAITLRSHTIAAVAKRANPRALPENLAYFLAIGPSQEALLTKSAAEEELVKQLARALRDCDVEPAADSALAITGDTTGTYWAQDRILVRRAFKGFTKVHLHQEFGGRSQGCFVWRIEAQKGRDKLQPFIAKAALIEDLAYELNTYRDLVRDHIPFPFRAPLLETRFVTGGSRALLVSAFVTRAQRFDEYLSQAEHPELPIAVLFRHALANWRTAAKESRRVSIGAMYVAEQQQYATDRLKAPRKRIPGGGPMLPNPDYLSEAHDHCLRNGWKCMSPSDLWVELRALPKGNFHLSSVHGDLNVRNIFVRWNATDTILIDFSNAGKRDFLARDPAKLETSIALTCRRHGRGLLSLKVLRALYLAPLLPMRKQFPADGRIEAIRHVRREAGGEGITNHEYGIVIACHLLRYASISPDAVVDADLASRRALSYSIACQLVESL